MKSLRGCEELEVPFFKNFPCGISAIELPNSSKDYDFKRLDRRGGGGIIQKIFEPLHHWLTDLTDSLTDSLQTQCQDVTSLGSYCMLRISVRTSEHLFVDNLHVCRFLKASEPLWFNITYKWKQFRIVSLSSTPFLTFYVCHICSFIGIISAFLVEQLNDNYCKC